MPPFVSNGRKAFFSSWKTAECASSSVQYLIHDFVGPTTDLDTFVETVVMNTKGEGRCGVKNGFRRDKGYFAWWWYWLCVMMMIGLAIEAIRIPADSFGHECEQELLTQTARCCIFLYEHLPSIFGLQSNPRNPSWSFLYPPVHIEILEFGKQSTWNNTLASIVQLDLSHAFVHRIQCHSG